MCIDPDPLERSHPAVPGRRRPPCSTRRFLLQMSHGAENSLRSMRYRATWYEGQNRGQSGLG